MDALINDKGEFIKILYDEKETQLGEHIVPLDGYYEVFNVERYNMGIWDFELKKWIGVGEPSVQPIPKPTEIEILRQEKEILAKSVYELTSIVELLVQGGVS